MIPCDSVTVVTPCEKLTALADKVRRLSPSHRDPERFHEDKSEIERDLRLLARRVGNG